MVEELSIFAIDGASSWEIAKCIGVDDMGLSRWVGRVLYDAETTNPYIYFVERLDDKHGLSESLVEVLIRVAVTLTKSSVSYNTSDKELRYVTGHQIQGSLP